MIHLLTLCLATTIAGPPIDITSYGAVGDGKTMSTPAIQTAIDKEAKQGGGVVLVPAGRFLTGSIHLKSNVELHLEPNAVLLGSAHRKDYGKAQWYALIIAENAHDIAITGEGTIDGQGKALAQDVLRMVDTGEVKIPPKGWRPSELDRPQILEIDHCKGVRIQGVTIENSACWVQTYRDCTNLTIKDVRVDSKTYWNNDGFDIVDCRKVAVTGCDVDAADDGICLKSDDSKLACEDVLIQNCKIRSSASAIKFGTSSRGGFRRVTVKDIQIHDTYRSCVALESVDGGILEDVLVDGIQAKNTGNAFFIRLGHRNLHAPPGRVRRVTLRNFDVQVPAGQPDAGYPFQGPPFTEPHNVCPSSIVGHEQVPIDNITLENIHLRMPGGGSKSVAYRTLAQVPERPSDYPEFTAFGEVPASALYLRHVRRLKIRDFAVTIDAPDYRPPFAADDLKDVDLLGLTVVGSPMKFEWRSQPRTKSRNLRSLGAKHL